MKCLQIDFVKKITEAGCRGRKFAAAHEEQGQMTVHDGGHERAGDETRN